MLYDAIQFLKGALGRNLPGGTPSTYVFHGGCCFARNQAILASYPCPELPSTFGLASDGLEKALRRMAEQPELSAGDNEGTLVLRKGRLRTSLQILYADPVEESPDAGTWGPVPAGLVAAIAKALPFVSPQGTWQRGVKLGAGHVAAVSNRVAIEAEVPGLDLGRTEILSDDCAAYLAAADEPNTMHHEPGVLWFGWPSGAWMKCQLLAYEWGDVVDRVMNGAGDAAPVPIDDVWRDALTDVTALGGSTVTVGPEGISSKADYSVVDVEMDIPVDRVTEWAGDVLVEVSKVADRWNPAATSAARFYGPLLRGVVVGIRR